MGVCTGAVLAVSTFHQYSRGLCLAKPQTNAWLFPIPISLRRQTAATTRHVVSPLASSTHEAPSQRESGEQDQRQENEPHVHTAAADAHGIWRKKSHLSLSQKPLVGHNVGLAIARDSMKRPGTKGIKSPPQITGHSPMSHP